MTVLEFLKTEDAINLAAIARKMYPNNLDAKGYLWKKMTGNNNRKFTEKDAEMALKALKELSIKIINLET